ncbi:NACHT domain-containing protein [Amycolatopsis australiensis]|uniref:NACHT domain-containing protein n=1 Tax=Amycolatopsis australiensis TaxID=546364 RepID=A0A1K1QU10_9PSEU|nr:hypothetical protein [Amycolatopsis australiensis]SFW63169.1 hypothetical protein SAMN04489730_2221 [Amycolatopsis australiensis]
MTDYRLDGLSTRTFEHLIQSLALDAIANTVTPFGDGPDGGREATFSGVTHYGASPEYWDGYGIIQAKFLQRPKSSGSDGDWIARELQKELRKYHAHKARRDLDYYIIATNVTLSAVENSGGKDKVIKILEDFTKRNELKGFDIWDYDKIRILLDNNESVRRAYAAWITTGDVLMQISNWLSGHRPDYHKLIVNYLQKELLSDQYAKLEQAGHTAEEAIPLAQVFVDLPVTENVYLAAERYFGSLPEETRNFVEFVATESKRLLASRTSEDDIDAGRSRQAPGRFVLIGGPGQGKTTLGQYVCQMFRCSLLKDVSKTLLDLETRQVMQAFDSRATSGKLPIPGARRLPLRVVLSDFAAALAEKRTTSLLTYLTEAFCKRTNSDLSAREFEAIIVEYPIILVLDGLDEVPASSNRDQVLTAVQDFNIDIASSQMDVLIVATSRPQGYNEDFSPGVYRHLWLTPLPIEKALEYGENLAKVRFSDDSFRIEKIVGRLRLASRASATARIMRSPLQVTILTLLVDRRGQLPQERWALFDEYYTLIYQRETERDIPAAAILRERKDDIDAVHRIVGLLLQVESETSGSTDAKLTTDQFSKLVETYLASEGNTGDALASLRDAIIEGAANRLVFLVGLEAGQVGFEIRSLQEFMAAEGLLDAEDWLVQGRLRSVAGNANWRNVTVFAAGKIFAERRYLRDTIESICLDLNDDDSDLGSMVTYAGSELALDLLEDGPVARQPAKSRSLTRVALRLLQIAGAQFARRLAGVYQDSTRDIYVEELIGSFSSGDPEARKNSWLCLDALMHAGFVELQDLASRALIDYAPDPETISTILSEAKLPISGWHATFAESILPGANACEVRRLNAMTRLAIHEGRARLKGPDWLGAAVDSVSVQPLGRVKPVRIFNVDYKRPFGDASIVRLSSNEWSNISGGIEGMPSVKHPSWDLVQSVARFETSPSKERLAEAIHTMVDRQELYDNYFTLPPASSWPMQECLLMVLMEGRGERLAKAVEDGLLGDKKDWISWQNDWSKQGVPLAELATDALDVVNLKKSGRWFPVRASSLHFRLLDRSALEELVSLESPVLNRALIFDIANEVHGVRRRRFQASFIEKFISNLLIDTVRSGTWTIVDTFASANIWEPPINEEWVGALAAGIRAGGWDHGFRREGKLADWIWRAFCRFPEVHELICGLVSFESPPGFTQGDFDKLSRMDLSLNPEARICRAIIGLRSGASLDAVWSDVVAAFDDSQCSVNAIFEAVRSDSFTNPDQMEKLLKLYNLAFKSPERKSIAVATIRAALRGRQSVLIDREKWLELGFDATVRDVITLSDVK